MAAATIHLTCGMAGAGKTTLAKKLAAKLPALRLSPDEWIEPLMQDKHNRDEMDRLRPAVQELQWNFALELSRLGNNVVWEQGFWDKSERIGYLNEARQNGLKVVLHYLDIPVDILKARIEQRNRELPSGSFPVDPEEIDIWMTWFDAPGQGELETYDDHRIYRPGDGHRA